VVQIHYRLAPFHEKILLSTRGTTNQPIKLIGLPGPNGERPIIDGDTATSSASLGYQNWSYTPLMGVIAVARGANTPAAGKVGYIEINGLEVRNTTGKHYLDTTGTSQSYWSSGGAIYLRGAEHVLIRNCELHNAYNGIVAECYSSESEVNRDLLIEKCYFHDNSVSSSWSGDNLQVESVSVTVQFCRFDPNLNRNKKASVSDRSEGAIHRYNSIEGGSYLVEFIQPSGSTSIVAADRGYAATQVYGNTFINRSSDGSSLIRFGGAYGSSSNFRPLLYFYDNTVLLDSSSRTVFSLAASSTTVEARNNVFHCTTSTFQILNSSGTVNLGVNWATTGWFSGWNGVVNNSAAMLSGANPGFVNLAGEDFHLAANSVLRNAAGTLSAGVPPVLFQYKTLAQCDARPNVLDLGAFFYFTPPVVTTGAASAVTDTSATLNGSVTPNTGTASVYFEWGTSAAYGSASAPFNAGSGSTPAAFQVALSGLSGNKTYHFRFAATVGANTYNGADQTLTTSNTVPVANPD
jgi:hypothetical protein